MPHHVAEEEALRRLRIVCHALGAALSQEEIAAAVAIWEQEFQYLPEFSSPPFIQRLEEVLPPQEKNAKIRRIRGAFVQAMFMTPGELERVPVVRSCETLETLVTVGQKVEPSVRGGEPARSEAEQGGPMVVFNAMLAGIYRLVVGQDEAAAARLRRHLLTKLSSLGLGGEAVKCLKPWCEALISSGSRLIEGVLFPREMSAFIHEIYVWSCDEIGPMSTDRSFGQAIRECEAMPEAKKFSPRKLL